NSDLAGHNADASSLETIVRRFLRTHALVGLDDLTARYPIDPAQATELLEGWEKFEGLIRLESMEDGAPVRWSEPRNLAEVRRLWVALRRRESVAVRPEVFADFVARRQHVHPATQLAGRPALSDILEQLRGFAAPAELWESDLLPRRLTDYRPAWLDDALTGGGWLWRAAHSEPQRELRSALVPRDFEGHWPTPEDAEPLSADEARVLDLLFPRGACFATDLARSTGIEPSKVRLALVELLECGLVTNDRFDPLRPSGQAWAGALAQAAAAAASQPRLGRRRGVFRRPASTSERPEGR